MLGGLARWLRAAGYEAVWKPQASDAELVREAQENGLFLLSSDSGFVERKVIRDGAVQFLLIPRGLHNVEMLAFVLGELALPLKDSRCMICGGELCEVPKREAQSEAPPLAYENQETFFRCARCKKLYWHGTHWQRISASLARAQSKARRESRAESEE